MRHLGQYDIASVLIEGGATVNWNALSSGVVDKLFLFYAPKIMGEGAVPFVASAGPGHTHVALGARRVRLHQFGEDFAVEGYLRDVYQE
jgi:diaminohydroxyphosphoribosylaminopyrimidine deaminase/5-amino-6-(5-phosphoribosylamino)uracil reductase